MIKKIIGERNVYRFAMSERTPLGANVQCTFGGVTTSGWASSAI